jgi:hypothetical protein
MCIATASAFQDPLPNGDKSAMFALFVRECVMEVNVTNIFLYPMLVMMVVF